jgi:hypothetical protein
LALGQVLYESGAELRDVYFPTDSIVSLLYVLADGASAEIAVVGNDGPTSFAGSWVARLRLIALGTAAPNVALHAGLITQMSRLRCNRHHSLDKQLAVLPLRLDRLPSIQQP